MFSIFARAETREAEKCSERMYSEWKHTVCNVSENVAFHFGMFESSFRRLARCAYSRASIRINPGPGRVKQDCYFLEDAAMSFP